MHEIGQIAEAILRGLRDGTLPVKSGFECPHCFNSGWRMVEYPQFHYTEGAVRCNECEYWHFWRQRHREAA